MIPPALLQALTNSCGDLWLGGQRRLVEEAIEQAYIQGFEDADLPAGAFLRIQAPLDCVSRDGEYGKASFRLDDPAPTVTLGTAMLSATLGQVIDAGSLAPAAEYRFTDRLRLESMNWLGLGSELRDASLIEPLTDCLRTWAERYPNEEPDNGRRLDLDTLNQARNKAADQVNGKAQGYASSTPIESEA